MSRSSGFRRRRLSPWILPLALGLILAGRPRFAASEPATGSAPAPDEYAVKSALLYNFARFVEWPTGTFATTDAPFVIGVLGDDPIGPSLERVLAGKTVTGHAIVIRRWRRVRDRGPCQMLYVAGEQSGDLERVLRELGDQPVLTVADFTDFARQGGMIEIVVEKHHLRFEINAAGAEHSHLKISSRLLSLAHVVAGPR